MIADRNEFQAERTSMTEHTSSSHNPNATSVSDRGFETQRLLDAESTDFAPAGLSPSSRLQSIYAPVAQEMLKVEELLANVFHHEHPFINDLLQHGSLLGGKRMRPALLLLTAKACGHVRDEHYVLATAIEMIHTASLVHDDILDEADTRRHVPTIHRRWNQESSVLFGDYLFTQAFHLVGDRVGGRACGWIARITNRVCEGELRQIASRGQFDLGIDEYFRIIEAKTAALCQCATHLGAVFALAEDTATADQSLAQTSAELSDPNNASHDQVSALSEYGRLLGMAFQIADDVLDLDGAEQVAGKSLGRDLELAKATLPLILAMQAASATDRQRMYRDLQDEAVSAEQVRRWVHRHNGVEAARDVAREHADRAANLVRTQLPNSPAQQTLIALCQFVIERSY